MVELIKHDFCCFKGNLKAFLDELIQSYQNMKSENELQKKNLVKLNQEKEDGLENIKRQYERQKQKDLETIREYISKVLYKML